MTPAERRRHDFIENTKEMSAGIAKELVEQATKAYDALTDAEREKFDNPSKPCFIVRAMLMIVGNDAVQKYNVEAIKFLIPQIKRVLNRRFY